MLESQSLFSYFKQEGVSLTWTSAFYNRWLDFSPVQIRNAIGLLYLRR